MDQWKRRQFVTPGSDPTVVVEWSKGDTKITEFQNTFVLVGSGKLDLISELHRALENAHNLENEIYANDDLDTHIYGEA